MIVCEFNNDGYKAYKSLITDIQDEVAKNDGDIKKGYNQDLKNRVKELQKNKTLTNNFEYQISLDVKQFQNRHELGIYLEKVFEKIPTFKLVKNYKLWDWISLQYFDLIFTEKGTASD